MKERNPILQASEKITNNIPQAPSNTPDFVLEGN